MGFASFALHVLFAICMGELSRGYNTRPVKVAGAGCRHFDYSCNALQPSSFSTLAGARAFLLVYQMRRSIHPSIITVRSLLLDHAK